MEGEKNENARYMRYFIAAVISVTAIVLATPYLVLLYRHLAGNQVDASGHGSFGDQFGSVNAWFSGLAFAGLIFTLLMQRRELSLQRIELSDSRDIFRQQKDIASRQAIESTLFGMLKLQTDIVLSLSDDVFWGESGSHSHASVQGTRVFESMRNRVLSRLDSQHKGRVITEFTPDALSGRADQLQVGYQRLYQKELHERLGHYFRLTYHIFKFIHEMPDSSHRTLLVRIARARLSDSELCLLFYNCVAGYGRDKFLEIAESINLFDNLDVHDLADWRDFALANSTFSNVDEKHVAEALRLNTEHANYKQPRNRFWFT